jgi:hypothetical protein
MLANTDLNELRAKVLSAYRADDAVLCKFREFARRMKSEVRPLRTYSVNAVSFVSADGGDNRHYCGTDSRELLHVEVSDANGSSKVGVKSGQYYYLIKEQKRDADLQTEEQLKPGVIRPNTTARVLRTGVVWE